jgi:hypothetical protein
VVKRVLALFAISNPLPEFIDLRHTNTEFDNMERHDASG